MYLNPIISKEFKMTEPTLYIIMRRDIPDMNPGKAMAQASHATSDFHRYESVWGIPTYDEWTEERSFGRVILLSADLDVLKSLIDTHSISGITMDPTYPWRNYYYDTMLTKEYTCAWVYVDDKNPASEELMSLNLHT